MNKFNYFNIDVYEKVLKNGLTLILMPDKRKKDVYITLTTKFGSVNTEFKYNDEYIKVPNGIAHFLEHKMFEMESGEDVFAFFNKTGTYSNAFTNYFNTSYIIAGNKSFKKNLNYLLDYVQKPYFTDENVLKEKGIITEELKMYLDMPDSLIFEKSLYNLFINNPIRYSVGGEVTDILEITKEDLYKCYETYYNPKNMFLIINGNFNYETAIKIIEENQSKKEFNDVIIETKKYDEPDNVYKEYEVIKSDVSTPYISYALKIPTHNLDIEPKKLNLYISILFDLLFDDTSLLYEKLSNDKLIQSMIDIDNIFTDKHYAISLIFKSNYYNEVIDLIDKTLENINITKEELERKKKVIISNIINTFDNISNTNNMVLDNKLMYDNIYTNLYDIIMSLNIDELNDLISKLIFKKSIVILEK